jgi:hypothetical protein
VKASLISLAAGSLCLPATYTLTRHGSYEISITAIITIAILGTWLALWYVNRGNDRASWWTLGGAFAVGAVVSEALSFAYYYFDYGHTDAKLSVGIAVSIIEGGVIALLGAATVIGTFFALRRITTRSRLDAQ